MASWKQPICADDKWNEILNIRKGIIFKGPTSFENIVVERYIITYIPRFWISRSDFAERVTGFLNNSNLAWPMGYRWWPVEGLSRRHWTLHWYTYSQFLIWFYKPVLQEYFNQFSRPRRYNNWPLWHVDKSIMITLYAEFRGFSNFRFEAFLAQNRQFSGGP